MKSVLCTCIRENVKGVKYNMFKWLVSCLGVHTVKIIRYGTVPVFFIQFRYANSIDTRYFLYFVDVFEILSRALVLGKVWWGWTSTM